MLTGTPLLLVFLLTMAIMLMLIIKFKYSAIISLFIASLILGIFSGMSLPDVLKSITAGFGGTMGSLGLVIAFGGIFGLFLTESGGTEELAKALLRKFGKKLDLLAVNLTGFIISIPVFAGAAYIMLAPLINALSKLTKKKIAGYSGALFTGLVITHCLVPPTPGPVAVAGVLNANIGFVILYGALIGIVCSLIAGWLLGNVIGDKVGGYYGEGEEEEELSVAEDYDKLLERDYSKPSAGLVVGLIVLPAVMIAFGAMAPIFMGEGLLNDICTFVGSGTVALFISMMITAFAMKKYVKKPVMTLFDDFSDKMGNVLLIVAVGGCFGQIITDTGLANVLIDMLSAKNMPILFLAYLLSLIIRAATGSCTVAMLSAATIFGSVAVSMGYTPVIVTLAICAGAIGLSIPTDGGWWIGARLGKLDMKTALIGLSVPTSLASILAFVGVLLLNTMTGVLPGI